MAKKLLRRTLTALHLYHPARNAWFSLKRPDWFIAEKKRLAFRKSLAPRGALVFDVGANVGEYAADFLHLGCRVVSVEPHPACAATLTSHFGNNPNFHLVQAALGDSPGSVTLHLADESAISSCAPDWIDSVHSSGRFQGHQWNKTLQVPMTTLDQLIATHGRPAHTKIDVEGFEPQVLAGLSQHAGLLSLEFTPELIDRSISCLDRLASLTYTEFNYADHGLDHFALDRWLPLDEMKRTIRSRAGDGRALGGDLFAR
ncbi:MAG TPA: FkbM family methyltransferase [Phycisphaerae bacterium]|nr:FkbM family methyltransferase [Phycisphaerae bacterium]